MNSLNNKLVILKDNIEKTLISIQQFIDNAPAGSLNCDERERGISYYQRTTVDGKPHKTFIRQDNITLAKKLATKDYYRKLKPLLEKELQALNQFLTSYHPNDKYQLFDDMIECRKELIAPLISPAFAAWQDWLETPYIPYRGYPERLIYETDRGEMVRSKSELIIANNLNAFSDELDYRYEQEHWLPEQAISIHPDFTIIIKKTGRILYWEHGGMMSDPSYADDFVNKINQYISNGIIPGRDLIITFETQNHPLNTSSIKKTILSFL